MTTNNPVLNADRMTGPASSIPSGLIIPVPETFQLDNGIPVHFFRGGKQDVSIISVIFFSGTTEQDRLLQAGFTISMLKEGCRGKSSSDIASFFDYHGASAGFQHGRHESSATLACINRTLTDVLPLFAEIIMRPEFPETELQLMKTNRKQDFISENKRVDVKCNRLFLKTLYGGDHPYGQSASENDFDMVERHWLSRFALQHYHSGNCAIVASGNIPPDLDKLLNRLFSEMPSGTSPQANVYAGEFPLSAGLEVTETVPESVQSAVITGCRSISRNHPDYIRLNIANSMLGGFFGSRLMKNIREDKGYTYGIYSRAESNKLSGTFTISAETGTEYTQALIDEIFNELEGLHKRPADTKELDLLKRYLSGSLIRSFDGVIAAAEMFRNCLPYDMDYKIYYQTVMDSLQTITSEELAETANKYLNPSQMLVAVAGKK